MNRKSTKLAYYMTDRHVSIIGKFKVFFSALTTVIYFVFAIVILPEILIGPIGFIDDLFILVWAIGNIKEELENYKGPSDSSTRGSRKVYRDPNIIDDVQFEIRDEE